MKKPRGRLVGILIAVLVLAGGLLTACSPAPGPCRGYVGKVICASKATGRVYMVQNGVVINSGLARFGGYASDGTGPWFTREGRFRIFRKSTNEYSNLYHVNMPFFMAFSGGQGFHYSSEFARGYNSSHGCVGLSSWNFAQSLFNWAPMGTPVVVYR